MTSNLCFLSGTSDNCPQCKRSQHIEELKKKMLAETDERQQEEILESMWKEIYSPSWTNDIEKMKS